MDVARGRRGDFVQSLERGLSVIGAFGAGRRELTLSEVAAVTGLTRAAARRFLLTLVQLNYVRAEGKLFSLAPRILELGHAYLTSVGLAGAQSHVEELAGTIGETCSMAVLDRESIVYLLRVPNCREYGEAVVAGSKAPAYATSLGRVLLAALPPRELAGYLSRARLEPLTRYTIVDPARLAKVLERVRSNGYTVTDQEQREGVQTAAAVIRDPAGRVVAALDATVAASRTSMEALRSRVLPAVVAAAKRIEVELASRENTPLR